MVLNLVGNHQIFYGVIWNNHQNIIWNNHQDIIDNKTTNMSAYNNNNIFLRKSLVYFIKTTNMSAYNEPKIRDTYVR